MADDQDVNDHALIRVRLDWMDPGDFITGMSFGEPWNGFEVVWLDMPAIYALDRVWVDAGNGGLFESEEPSLAIEGSLTGGSPILYDVSPNGERTEMWAWTDDSGVRRWNFSGWVFEALPDTPST